jgi:hypothetical protein
VHRDHRLPAFHLSVAAVGLFLIAGASISLAASRAEDLTPQTPSAFLPGGMLGVQLGRSWQKSKQSPTLRHLACRPVDHAAEFEEVCFFRVGAESRVAGAAIHDGFMARKGDHVVLIGTGIAIKNADDPLAESVVENFQSQIHLEFEHTGDNVLFVKLPAVGMSADEFLGFSRKAPVLLVQLESKSNELAVLYGYLAPVKAFGALTAD